MKKILALLIAVFVVFSLSGCKNNEEQETQSSYSECESASYTATDIQQLIEDWQIVQTEQQTDNSLYTTTHVEGKEATLTVPVLQTSDFTLEELYVFEDATYYLFMPTQNEPTVASKIRMHISNTLSYEACIESYYKLYDDGNVAYDFVRKLWYINNNGIFISISFSDNIVLTDASQISDYFTFETYTAGESSGNDHVVS